MPYVITLEKPCPKCGSTQGLCQHTDSGDSLTYIDNFLHKCAKCGEVINESKDNFAGHFGDSNVGSPICPFCGINHNDAETKKQAAADDKWVEE